MFVLNVTIDGPYKMKNVCKLNVKRIVTVKNVNKEKTVVKLQWKDGKLNNVMYYQFVPRNVLNVKPQENVVNVWMVLL